MKRGGIVLMCLGLAACAEQVERVVPPLSGECPAGDYQALIGQGEAAARALQFDGPSRIIPHGSAITADYRPERINFELDPQGKISAVSCF